METNIDFFNTHTYFYDLPQELIAQEPVEPRDSARLLVLNKAQTEISHTTFTHIKDYLKPGDLLVMNDTRVFPARLHGVKKNGSANVEIFFIKPSEESKNKWVALVKPGRKLKPGTVVIFEDETEITVEDILEDGLRYVEFDKDINAFDEIHKLGSMPLPHYITSRKSLPEQYQTVYANKEKEHSVAAPTAGLHFTKELLAEIENKGVNTAYITLEVGLGTFRPVKAENIKDHIMHTEFCEISEETVRKVEETKKNGGRVIAVGTTSVRTLESFAKKFGELKAGAIDTNLFIYPGYEFKVVDALITNFHLPESTLLMLVSAFAGYEFTMEAYKKAVNESYRFFSFGDAMFIY